MEIIRPCLPGSYNHASSCEARFRKETVGKIDETPYRELPEDTAKKEVFDMDNTTTALVREEGLACILRASPQNGGKTSSPSLLLPELEEVLLEKSDAQEGAATRVVSGQSPLGGDGVRQSAVEPKETESSRNDLLVLDETIQRAAITNGSELHRQLHMKGEEVVRRKDELTSDKERYGDGPPSGHLGVSMASVKPFLDETGQEVSPIQQDLDTSKQTAEFPPATPDNSQNHLPCLAAVVEGTACISAGTRETVDLLHSNSPTFCRNAFEEANYRVADIDTTHAPSKNSLDEPMSTVMKPPSPHSSDGARTSRASQADFDCKQNKTPTTAAEDVFALSSTSIGSVITSIFQSTSQRSGLEQAGREGRIDPAQAEDSRHSAEKEDDRFGAPPSSFREKQTTHSEAGVATLSSSEITEPSITSSSSSSSSSSLSSASRPSPVSSSLESPGSALSSTTSPCASAAENSSLVSPSRLPPEERDEGLTASNTRSTDPSLDTSQTTASARQASQKNTQHSQDSIQPTEEVGSSSPSSSSSSHPLLCPPPSSPLSATSTSSCDSSVTASPPVESLPLLPSAPLISDRESVPVSSKGKSSSSTTPAAGVTDIATPGTNDTPTLAQSTNAPRPSTPLRRGTAQVSLTGPSCMESLDTRKESGDERTPPGAEFLSSKETEKVVLVGARKETHRENVVPVVDRDGGGKEEEERGHRGGTQVIDQGAGVPPSRVQPTRRASPPLAEEDKRKSKEDHQKSAPEEGEKVEKEKEAEEEEGEHCDRKDRSSLVDSEVQTEENTEKKQSMTKSRGDSCLLLLPSCLEKYATCSKNSGGAGGQVVSDDELMGMCRRFIQLRSELVRIFDQTTLQASRELMSLQGGGTAVTSRSGGKEEEQGSRRGEEEVREEEQRQEGSSHASLPRRRRSTCTSAHPVSCLRPQGHRQQPCHHREGGEKHAEDFQGSSPTSPSTPLKERLGEGKAHGVDKEEEEERDERRTCSEERCDETSHCRRKRSPYREPLDPLALDTEEKEELERKDNDFVQMKKENQQEWSSEGPQRLQRKNRGSEGRTHSSSSSSKSCGGSHRDDGHEERGASGMNNSHAVNSRASPLPSRPRSLRIANNHSRRGRGSPGEIRREESKKEEQEGKERRRHDNSRLSLSSSSSDSLSLQSPTSPSNCTLQQDSRDPSSSSSSSSSEPCFSTMPASCSSSPPPPPSHSSSSILTPEKSSPTTLFQENRPPPRRASSSSVRRLSSCCSPSSSNGKSACEKTSQPPTASSSVITRRQSQPSSSFSSSPPSRTLSKTSDSHHPPPPPPSQVSPVLKEKRRRRKRLPHHLFPSSTPAFLPPLLSPKTPPQPSRGERADLLHLFSPPPHLMNNHGESSQERKASFSPARPPQPSHSDFSRASPPTDDMLLLHPYDLMNHSSRHSSSQGGSSSRSIGWGGGGGYGCNGDLFYDDFEDSSYGDDADLFLCPPPPSTGDFFLTSLSAQSTPERRQHFHSHPRHLGGTSHSHSTLPSVDSSPSLPGLSSFFSSSTDIQGFHCRDKETRGRDAYHDDTGGLGRGSKEDDNGLDEDTDQPALRLLSGGEQQGSAAQAPAGGEEQAEEKEHEDKERRTKEDEDPRGEEQREKTGRKTSLSPQGGIRAGGGGGRKKERGTSSPLPMKRNSSQPPREDSLGNVLHSTPWPRLCGRNSSHTSSSLSPSNEDSSSCSPTLESRPDTHLHQQGEEQEEGEQAPAREEAKRRGRKNPGTALSSVSPLSSASETREGHQCSKEEIHGSLSRKVSCSSVATEPAGSSPSSSTCRDDQHTTFLRESRTCHGASKEYRSSADTAGDLSGRESKFSCQNRQRKRSGGGGWGMGGRRSRTEREEEGDEPCRDDVADNKDEKKRRVDEERPPHHHPEGEGDFEAESDCPTSGALSSSRSSRSTATDMAQGGQLRFTSPFSSSSTATFPSGLTAEGCTYSQYYSYNYSLRSESPSDSLKRRGGGEGPTHRHDHSKSALPSLYQHHLLHQPPPSPSLSASVPGKHLEEETKTNADPKENTVFSWNPSLSEVGNDRGPSSSFVATDPRGVTTTSLPAAGAASSSSPSPSSSSSPAQIWKETYAGKVVQYESQRHSPPSSSSFPGARSRSLEGREQSQTQTSGSLREDCTRGAELSEEVLQGEACHRTTRRGRRKGGEEEDDSSSKDQLSAHLPAASRRERQSVHTSSKTTSMSSTLHEDEEARSSRAISGSARSNRKENNRRSLTSGSGEARPWEMAESEDDRGGQHRVSGKQHGDDLCTPGEEHQGIEDGRRRDENSRSYSPMILEERISFSSNHFRPASSSTSPSLFFQDSVVHLHHYPSGHHDLNHHGGGSEALYASQYRHGGGGGGTGIPFFLSDFPFTRAVGGGAGEGGGGGDLHPQIDDDVVIPFLHVTSSSSSSPASSTGTANADQMTTSPSLLFSASTRSSSFAEKNSFPKKDGQQGNPPFSSGLHQTSLDQPPPYFTHSGTGLGARGSNLLAPPSSLHNYGGTDGEDQKAASGDSLTFCNTYYSSSSSTSSSSTRSTASGGCGNSRSTSSTRGGGSRRSSKNSSNGGRNPHPRGVKGTRRATSSASSSSSQPRYYPPPHGHLDGNEGSEGECAMPTTVSGRRGGERHVAKDTEEGEEEEIRKKRGGGSSTGTATVTKMSRQHPSSNLVLPHDTQVHDSPTSRLVSIAASSSSSVSSRYRSTRDPDKEGVHQGKTEGGSQAETPTARGGGGGAGRGGGRGGSGQHHHSSGGGGGGGGNCCRLCRTRQTPQWRYLDSVPVCNACYMRARKKQQLATGLRKPVSLAAISGLIPPSSSPPPASKAQAHRATLSLGPHGKEEEHSEAAPHPRLSAVVNTVEREDRLPLMGSARDQAANEAQDEKAESGGEMVKGQERAEERYVKKGGSADGESQLEANPPAGNTAAEQNETKKAGTGTPQAPPRSAPTSSTSSIPSMATRQRTRGGGGGGGGGGRTGGGGGRTATTTGGEGKRTTRGRSNPVSHTAATTAKSGAASQGDADIAPLPSVCSSSSYGSEIISDAGGTEAVCPSMSSTRDFAAQQSFGFQKNKGGGTKEDHGHDARVTATTTTRPTTAHKEMLRGMEELSSTEKKQAEETTENQQGPSMTGKALREDTRTDIQERASPPRVPPSEVLVSPLHTPQSLILNLNAGAHQLHLSPPFLSSSSCSRHSLSPRGTDDRSSGSSSSSSGSVDALTGVSSASLCTLDRPVEHDEAILKTARREEPEGGDGNHPSRGDERQVKKKKRLEREEGGSGVHTPQTAKSKSCLGSSDGREKQEDKRRSDGRLQQFEEGEHSNEEGERQASCSAGQKEPLSSLSGLVDVKQQKEKDDNGDGHHMSLIEHQGMTTTLTDVPACSSAEAQRPASKEFLPGKMNLSSESSISSSSSSSSLPVDKPVKPSPSSLHSTSPLSASTTSDRSPSSYLLSSSSSSVFECSGSPPPHLSEELNASSTLSSSSSSAPSPRLSPLSSSPSLSLRPVDESGGTSKTSSPFPSISPCPPPPSTPGNPASTCSTLSPSCSLLQQDTSRPSVSSSPSIDSSPPTSESLFPATSAEKPSSTGFCRGISSETASSFFFQETAPSTLRPVSPSPGDNQVSPSLASDTAPVVPLASSLHALTKPHTQHRQVGDRSPREDLPSSMREEESKSDTGHPRDNEPAPEREVSSTAETVAFLEKSQDTMGKDSPGESFTRRDRNGSAGVKNDDEEAKAGLCLSPDKLPRPSTLLAPDESIGSRLMTGESQRSRRRRLDYSRIMKHSGGADESEEEEEEITTSHSRTSKRKRRKTSGIPTAPAQPDE